MAKLEPLAAGAAAIEESWRDLGRAGTWWTGAERAALAAEARAARACATCAERRAARSPWAGDATHAASGGLAAPVVDAVHRLSTDPGRLTVRWLEDLVAAGVGEEAAVELVAIVSFVAMADTLAVATGAPERALPAPEAGEPSRARPAGLEKSCAWVPTVDPARAEGPVALVYGMIERDAGFVFHVARALTAVPDAMATFLRGFFVHYHTHGAPKGTLSRPQVELLAASTSSINECFY
jgi:hypothetical protein